MKTPVHAAAIWIVMLGIVPSPARAAGLRIDREAREVRFPFSFINPSRLLEVYLCSPGGPTHETVIVTPVSGSEIRDGLLAIGLEPADAWNVSGPEGFDLTQGSRAVVILRWTWKGRTHEKVAEEVIERSGEGFPEFIRGFSVQAPDAPSGTADAAEFTYGARGSGRSSASYALLAHATSFPYLLPWTADPQIADDAVPELEALIEKKVEGTVTVRATTETELLALRRARRPAWGALFDELGPIARKIDTQKEAFREARAAAREARAAARAHLLAARIHVLYMKTYGIERAYQIRSLRAAGGRKAQIAEELAGQDAIGLSWAIRRSELELERAQGLAVQAEAEGPEAASRAERRVEATQCRIQALFHEWAIRVREKERLDTAARLESEESQFVKGILENDLLRTDAEIAQNRGRLRGARACEKRNALLAEGDLPAEAETEIAAMEAAGALWMEYGRLLEEKAKLLEKIRWAQEDANSSRPDRRRDALKRLTEYSETLKALNEKTAAAEARIKTAGLTP